MGATALHAGSYLGAHQKAQRRRLFPSWIPTRQGAGMTSPLLTVHDRQSAVWLKLKPYLEARRETLRRKNDTFSMTADKTIHVRGRIAELKAILSLGTDKPEVPNEEELFKD